MRLLIGVAAATMVLLSSTAAAVEQPRPKLLNECVTAAERNSAQWLIAPDGARIAAVTVGPARAQRAIVLAHEAEGNLCNWLPFGRGLSRKGYRVLAFDFRGSLSSPSPRRGKTRFDLDVIAAVRHLRRGGARRVAIIGGSLGATAAIVAASRLEPQPNAVVAVSPTTSFGPLNALAAAPSLRSSALFLVSDGDFDFPAQAREIFKRTRSADKKLVIVADGRRHGFSLVWDPGGDRNRRTIASFLDTRMVRG